MKDKYSYTLFGGAARKNAPPPEVTIAEALDQKPTKEVEAGKFAEALEKSKELWGTAADSSPFVAALNTSWSPQNITITDATATKIAMSEFEKLFRARFGDHDVDAIISAAKHHEDGTFSLVFNKGADPFKHALVMGIGWDCLSSKIGRSVHNIESSWEDLREWIKSYADLSNYDGDFFEYGKANGRYDYFLNETKG